MKYIVLFIFIASNLFSQDFEVAPVDIKFNANPGESQIKKVTIRNYSNTRQKYSIVYSDYEVDNEGKKLPVKKELAKHSMEKWLNINPSFFELNPNESKEVEVMLNVPADENVSTKWGKLGVQPAVEQSIDADEKAVAAGVLVVPRITIWVTYSPRNNKNYKAIIKDLAEISTPKDSIRKFSVTVVNTGENIIEGKVFLAVADLVTANEKKYSASEHKVFPGASKNITLSIPEKLKPGRYVVAAILDYGHRKPLEGTQIMIEQK